MIRTITDADISAWLVDLRSGCGPEGDPPLVEVFEHVIERMRRAEEQYGLVKEATRNAVVYLLPMSPAWILLTTGLRLALYVEGEVPADARG